MKEKWDVQDQMVAPPQIRRVEDYPKKKKNTQAKREDKNMQCIKS